MVDPLIVVKTLNHMIPVCTLLVLTTSVLRASMVVRVLGKAALGTLTTLAWLLQPSHKFWEIVSQPLGHDTRDQPLLFSAAFQHKAAWYMDQQLLFLVLNSLLVALLSLGLLWSWWRSPRVHNTNNVNINKNMFSLTSSPSLNHNKLEETIKNCLVDFSLEEIYGQKLEDREKFKRLLRALPPSDRQTALELLLQEPDLKNNFCRFLKVFKQNNSVPPMSQAQAVRALGGLTQEDLSVSQYQEKFHLLAQRAGLDPGKCTELFFEGLKPELLSVLTVRGMKPDFLATCEDLKAFEKSTKTQKESLGNLSSYNLRSRNKVVSSSYLLLSSSFPDISSDSFLSLIDTGAMSNYMSMDLANSLGLELHKCSFITLANGTNVSSFITKEEIEVRIGTFSFCSRFRVVRGLTYKVILGMEWWSRCNPLVDLHKGQVMVKEKGKGHTLTLISQPMVRNTDSTINTLDNSLTAKIPPTHEKQDLPCFIDPTMIGLRHCLRIISPPTSPLVCIFILSLSQAQIGTWAALFTHWTS